MESACNTDVILFCLILSLNSYVWWCLGYFIINQQLEHYSPTFNDEVPLWKVKRLQQQTLPDENRPIAEADFASKFLKLLATFQEHAVVTLLPAAVIEPVCFTLIPTVYSDMFSVAIEGVAEGVSHPRQHSQRERHLGSWKREKKKLEKKTKRD